MYDLKLQKFEGPFDLLIELIEANKLDITEISLASVAEQYLSFLEKLDDVEIGYLADFLVIASRLLLLKSKMLLPKMQMSEEEEKDIFELKRQLELYQKFKQVASEIQKIFLSDEQFFGRDISSVKQVVFYPPSNIAAEDLRNYFREVLVDFPEQPCLPQEQMSRSISIKEKIDFIKELVGSRIKTTFQEMIKDSKSKSESIVSFLAVLELLKNNFISISQAEPFKDIEIMLNNSLSS